MSEAELIVRARAGDHTAFDALIEDHREVIFRYAYLITRDAHSAEDIAQEAVWRAYRGLSGFDQGLAFRPWLLRITRNAARNHQRDLGRRILRITRLIVAEANGREESADIEAMVELGARAERLHQLVARLRPEAREVIYLRFFLGLSVEATASALGVAEGTVKSRLARALKQLRALIEAEAPELMEELSP